VKLKINKIMKKIFFLFLTFFAIIQTYAQINISTGVDVGGSPIPPGNKDMLWKMVSPSPAIGNPFVEISPLSGTWNPSPVSGTSAQWIGSNSNPGGQKAGIYTFERIITVGSNIGVMLYNFAIAFDDDFVGIELVDPSGIVTDLSSKFTKGTKAYYLNNPISGEIKCPKEGKWILRVKINFIDTLAAFMLSGNFDFKGQCQTKIDEFEDKKCCVNGGTNLSTGWANSGGLAGNGLADDDWKITSPSSSPAYVSNPAVVSYAPASSNAQWITPKGGRGPSSTYQYKLVVPPGQEATLNFSRIGADNEVSMSTISSSGTTVRHSATFANYAFLHKNVILKQCLTFTLPAGTHIIQCDVSNLGTDYTGLLVEGCYTLKQVAPVCRCPEGWLSNTSNENGGVTTDGKCKKMVCGPIDIKPLPKNGTQVDGNIGFFWGNELWWYGTKENGGVPICR
jgi:hypothetical protein